MRRGMEDGHSHAPHDFPSLPPLLPLRRCCRPLSELERRCRTKDDRTEHTSQTTKRWTATFCRYNVTVCLARAIRDPASEKHRELF